MGGIGATFMATWSEEEGCPIPKEEILPALSWHFLRWGWVGSSFLQQPGYSSHRPEARQHPWDTETAFTGSNQVSRFPGSVPARGRCWYFEIAARKHTARWPKAGRTLLSSFRRTSLVVTCFCQKQVISHFRDIDFYCPNEGFSVWDTCYTGRDSRKTDKNVDSIRQT